MDKYTLGEILEQGIYYKDYKFEASIHFLFGNPFPHSSLLSNYFTSVMSRNSSNLHLKPSTNTKTENCFFLC